MPPLLFKNGMHAGVELYNIWDFAADPDMSDWNKLIS